MTIKALINKKKKSITKRLPHVSKEVAVKEKKIRSTVQSLCKNLPGKGKGCVTILASCITFIEHVASKKMKNFVKRMNKTADSTVDFTPCTSPSNSSNESQGCEFVTPNASPTSQDGKEMFSIEGSPSDVIEEIEDQEMEEYMSTNADDIDEIDAIVTEYEDFHQDEEGTLTTIKEFIFDDDNTKVIFHFNKTNKWTIEIIEDCKKTLPHSFPKKQGIPIPSLYLKAALPEKVNVKQGKEFVKRLVSNDLERVKAAIPEKVNMKQTKEYVKRVVSNDLERVKKSAGVVVELLISIDSSINLSSTLTNESFSRRLASVKTTYWYIRIVR